MNEEIKREDEAQLKFLKSVGDSLTARIEKESALHLEDHKANMKANSDLIAQILELRSTVKTKKAKFKELGGEKVLAQITQREQDRQKQLENAQINNNKMILDGESAEVQKEVAIKREHINELEDRIAELQQRKAQLQGQY